MKIFEKISTKIEFLTKFEILGKSFPQTNVLTNRTFSKTSTKIKEIISIEKPSPLYMLTMLYIWIFACRFMHCSFYQNFLYVNSRNMYINFFENFD